MTQYISSNSFIEHGEKQFLVSADGNEWKSQEHLSRWITHCAYMKLIVLRAWISLKWLRKNVVAYFQSQT